MKILYNPVIRRKVLWIQCLLNVWLSLVFTFHFALFLTTTWKRCDVNPYPWDWKVPWLNGCLMVSAVWKIMLLSTSLSGKNMSFLSWDSGKIVSILRYCLEIWLSKVHTNSAQSRPTDTQGRPTNTQKADRPIHMYTGGRLTNTHVHRRQTDRHTCTHKQTHTCTHNADRPTHMHTHNADRPTHMHTQCQTDRHTCTHTMPNRPTHMHTQARPTDTHAHTRLTNWHLQFFFNIFQIN